MQRGRERARSITGPPDRVCVQSLVTPHRAPCSAADSAFRGLSRVQPRTAGHATHTGLCCHPVPQSASLTGPAHRIPNRSPHQPRGLTGSGLPAGPRLPLSAPPGTGPSRPRCQPGAHTCLCTELLHRGQGGCSPQGRPVPFVCLRRYSRLRSPRCEWRHTLGAGE